MASSRLQWSASFVCGEERVGHRGHRHVAHVDLLLEDQVGEQAERAGVDRQLDREPPAAWSLMTKCMRGPHRRQRLLHDRADSSAPSASVFST